MHARPSFLLIRLVRTDAGILLVFASRALIEVEVELIAHRFRPFFLTNLHDRRQIVAFGDGLVADELVSVFREHELCGSGTISQRDGNDLSAGLHELAIIVHKTDFDFAILGDKKFGMRLHLGDEAASRRAGFDRAMIVAVFVSSENATGQGEGEESGREQFGFHGWN